MGLDFDLRTDWDDYGWETETPVAHAGSPIAGKVPRLKPWTRPASTDWMMDAACRGLPTEWWFPSAAGSPTAENRTARRICAGCPVRDRCGEHGRGERWGIWGDLNRESRRKAG